MSAGFLFYPPGPRLRYITAFRVEGSAMPDLKDNALEKGIGTTKL